jgi:hypothetical protein
MIIKKGTMQDILHERGILAMEKYKYRISENISNINFLLV